MTTAAAQRPPVVLTEEGGGVIATCKGCGWLKLYPSKAPARAAALGHKCKGTKKR